MFGWFKKKQPDPTPAPDSTWDDDLAYFSAPVTDGEWKIALESGFFDVVEFRKYVAAMGKNCDPNDVEITPLMEKFIRERPDHTERDKSDDPGLDEFFFLMALSEREDAARKQAEKDIKEDEARYGFTIPNREAVINQRVEDIFYMECNIAMTNYFNNRIASSDYDHRFKLERKLDRIADSVDRSATVANVTDFALQHPVTTALAVGAIVKVFDPRNNNRS